MAAAIPALLAAMVVHSRCQAHRLHLFLERLPWRVWAHGVDGGARITESGCGWGLGLLMVVSSSGLMAPGQSYAALSRRASALLQARKNLRIRRLPSRDRQPEFP